MNEKGGDIVLLETAENGRVMMVTKHQHPLQELFAWSVLEIDGTLYADGISFDLETATSAASEHALDRLEYGRVEDRQET